MRGRPEGAATVLLAHDPERFDDGGGSGRRPRAERPHARRPDRDAVSRAEAEPREPRASLRRRASTAAAGRRSTFTRAWGRPGRPSASAPRRKSRFSFYAPASGRALAMWARMQLRSAGRVSRVPSASFRAPGGARARGDRVVGVQRRAAALAGLGEACTPSATATRRSSASSRSATPMPPSANCPSPAMCVSFGGQNVCQLPAESACIDGDPCPTGFVCAANQCRNACGAGVDGAVNARWPGSVPPGGLLRPGNGPRGGGVLDSRELQRRRSGCMADSTTPNDGATSDGPFMSNPTRACSASRRRTSTRAGSRRGRGGELGGAPDANITTACTNCLPVTATTVVMNGGTLADVYVLQEPPHRPTARCASAGRTRSSSPSSARWRSRGSSSSTARPRPTAAPVPAATPRWRTADRAGAAGVRRGEPRQQRRRRVVLRARGLRRRDDGDPATGPGLTYGTAAIIPLIGGSAGGASDANSYGGGALQISAGQSITVSAFGAINAGGSGTTNVDGSGGGASGGAILLEAPTVAIAGNLGANGGGGMSGTSAGADATANSTAASGAVPYGGAGSAGTAINGTSGTSGTGANATGGGGGGAGTHANQHVQREREHHGDGEPRDDDGVRDAGDAQLDTGRAEREPSGRGAHARRRRAGARAGGSLQPSPARRRTRCPSQSLRGGRGGCLLGLTQTRPSFRRCRVGLTQTRLRLRRCRLRLTEARLPLRRCRLGLTQVRLPLGRCRLGLTQARLPLRRCRLGLTHARLPLRRCRLRLTHARLRLGRCCLPRTHARLPRRRWRLPRTHARSPRKRVSRSHVHCQEPVVDESERSNGRRRGLSEGAGRSCVRRQVSAAACRREHRAVGDGRRPPSRLPARAPSRRRRAKASCAPRWFLRGPLLFAFDPLHPRERFVARVDDQRARPRARGASPRAAATPAVHAAPYAAAGARGPSPDRVATLRGGVLDDRRVLRAGTRRCARPPAPRGCRPR